MTSKTYDLVAEVRGIITGLLCFGARPSVEQLFFEEISVRDCFGLSHYLDSALHELLEERVIERLPGLYTRLVVKTTVEANDRGLTITLKAHDHSLRIVLVCMGGRIQGVLTLETQSMFRTYHALYLPKGRSEETLHRVMKNAAEQVEGQAPFECLRLFEESKRWQVTLAWDLPPQV